MICASRDIHDLRRSICGRKFGSGASSPCSSTGVWTVIFFADEAEATWRGYGPLWFAPDFYGGGLNLAVFAKDGNVLIVLEQRVVAIDLKEGKYLWHLEPDTFPKCPFPIAHDGKVVLTSGAKRRLHRVIGDSR